MSVHPIYYVIAERIRKERKKRRLSQRALANLVGLTPARISHMEGSRPEMPNLQSLVNVAEAMGLTIKIDFVKSTKQEGSAHD